MKDFGGWPFIAIKRNGCGTKSKFDIVGGFRSSLIDGIMRATDAMTHRCVRRCQRGRGWSFTLRAVARGFMAVGTPAHLQSLLGALEAKFKEDVLRSSEDHDLKRERGIAAVQGAWAQELEDAKGQI